MVRPAHRTKLPAGRRPLATSLTALVLALGACGDDPVVPPAAQGRPTGPSPYEQELDSILQLELWANEFDGRIEEEFAAKLGRPVDQDLAEVGRFLFFDPILSLTQDNSCAGCHGPNVAFNDSKSISVGIHNNGVVGPGRTGPHNLRRAPTIINAAFYPNLMWEGRFASNALDAFDNSEGFSFPEPEGASLSHMEHLLGAAAFTPVVNRMEMAGFDFEGTNDEIRSVVAARVDSIGEYRDRFAEIFPEIEAGAAVGYEHIAQALAEFQFTLIRADAPLDRYARGDLDALTVRQKEGGALFFDRRASCFECHITIGYANQMFSDFDSHVLAVPQVTPLETNADFDGPAANEDFGLERVTGDVKDRYKFRTTPLRNAAFQPTFMHNGAFVCMDDAIRHHTQLFESIDRYSTSRLENSMRGPLGPFEPMLEVTHKLSLHPRAELSDDEILKLSDFVANALTDPDAAPEALQSLVPASLPSGLPVHDFDFTVRTATCN